MTTPDDVGRISLVGGGQMPVLGFGTWQIQGRQAHDSTLDALSVGYRHIDTATVYENEREVGQAIADSGLGRDELFITTKLPGHASNVRKTIDESLARLGVAYVDLWLIHWPPQRDNALELYEEMLAIRGDGLVRAVGVSNFGTPDIDALTNATGEVPEVNQIPWSPFLHDEREQRALEERHVVLEGYSPFKKSKLGHPVLVEIAAAHGVTPAQVVLRWHIQHDIVVIPKSVHRGRIEENFDVFGFSLDDAQTSRIDALAAT